MPYWSYAKLYSVLHSSFLIGVETVSCSPPVLETVEHSNHVPERALETLASVAPVSDLVLLLAYFA